MTFDERIYIPDRPSDSPEELVSEDILETSFSDASVSELTEAWRLYDGPDAGERFMAPAPYLLSSWLLKSEDYRDYEGLISPFAKLELSRETKDVSKHQDDLTSIYGFRLVNLETGANQKYDSVELVEFKLIAGAFFQRGSDEAALFGLAVALRSFRLGKFKLNDYKVWESHFSQ